MDDQTNKSNVELQTSKINRIGAIVLLLVAILGIFSFFFAQPTSSTDSRPIGCNINAFQSIFTCNGDITIKSNTVSNVDSQSMSSQPSIVVATLIPSTLAATFNITPIFTSTASTNLVNSDIPVGMAQPLYWSSGVYLSSFMISNEATSSEAGVIRSLANQPLTFDIYISSRFIAQHGYASGGILWPSTGLTPCFFVPLDTRKTITLNASNSSLHLGTDVSRSSICN